MIESAPSNFALQSLLERWSHGDPVTFSDTNLGEANQAHDAIDVDKLLTELEQYDALAAVIVALRVAKLRRAGVDANNWRTQLTDVKIGICLVALKRYAEAEPLLLRSVQALEAARGASHDHTQAGYRALRDLYAATGRPDLAAEWEHKLLPGCD